MNHTFVGVSQRRRISPQIFRKNSILLRNINSEIVPRTYQVQWSILLHHQLTMFVQPNFHYPQSPNTQAFLLPPHDSTVEDWVPEWLAVLKWHSPAMCHLRVANSIDQKQNEKMKNCCFIFLKKKVFLEKFKTFILFSSKCRTDFL